MASPQNLNRLRGHTNLRERIRFDLELMMQRTKSPVRPIWRPESLS
jgi:hypothetical protein